MSQAREILEDIIRNFSPEKFGRFFREKSRHFVILNEEYSFCDDIDFESGIKLGEINFPDSDSLIICNFEIKKGLSERAGKKVQYEKARNILKLVENQKYAGGIFIFHDKNGNFRFSLVYRESAGTHRQWNNFRRFTYFVSKDLTNKTFLQRIGEGDLDSLDDIKDSFSVDKVTNKFFDEFRQIFDKTKQEFEKTNKNTVCLWLKDRYSDDDYREQINKFTFTFLGRIIFLYFLLRKGWIENKKDYIRKIVEDKNQINLYFNIFEPLFFEVFARKEDERSREIRSSYKDTPYLNGGLFERSEIEGAMHRAGISVLFEDKFIREIVLEFFEAYNFTVDENSPDDQEVSIDPEMLGKVFENTLAEEERGKKGTFYTPREIVHFMVKDSLWQYLKNETDIKPELLHELIYHEDFDLDILPKDKIRQIDTILEGIKILDPAVGSAAFPVEMMQVLVKIRKRLNVKVGNNINEVTLKKSFIKNNLYGVDIDPSAIEIAKLRLWLSLIVDYEKSEAEPLPNLDFQFRVGNSLQEKIDDVDIFGENNSGIQELFKKESDYERVKIRMIDIKDQFYTEDEAKKRKLKKEFDNLERQLIEKALTKHRQSLDAQLKNSHFAKIAKEVEKTIAKINQLEQKIKDGTYKLFKPDFHFSEVFDRKDQNNKKIDGFDIVIGNPPYGVKIEEDIKEWHRLGSKDSYGVFISTALKRFLRPGGVLSYIVSDTWLTIKTHKPLREQVLSKQLHKVIRVHQDCFEATVNACIVSLTNKLNDNGKLLGADLTNISTRKEVEEMRSKLYHLSDFINQSTPKFAVYEYDQDLIKINSNIPIFIGSPKLFLLMNDTTCKIKEREVCGKKIKVRCINFNNKIIELVRFGDISDVRVGLQTGKNKAYLFQNQNTRGSYRDINHFKEFLITSADLNKIVNNDGLRLKIISKGFHKSINDKSFDSDLWFSGKYIIPYDKGGESDTETGWLPNYYVPTDFFIDWSCEAVKNLSTNENARFQNTDYYFKDGLTLSYTGQYAPNLRLNSTSVFDVGGSCIFPDIVDKYQILGNFVCKITKYFGKNWIDHSVNFQIDENKELPMLISENKEIINIVLKIINAQRKNCRYDYMSNEQKEIDKLVYKMYGLNADDIKEVETWYARRYPKLARFCNI